MKCFLEGCPVVKIGFSRDLVIGAKDKNLKGENKSVCINYTFYRNT